MRVRESINVTVQTRRSVLVINQFFRRGKGEEIEMEEREEFEEPQDGFRGRQKMWGDLSPENLG